MPSDLYGVPGTEPEPMPSLREQLDRFGRIGGEALRPQPEPPYLAAHGSLRDVEHAGDVGERVATTDSVVSRRSVRVQAVSRSIAGLFMANIDYTHGPLWAW